MKESTSSVILLCQLWPGEQRRRCRGQRGTGRREAGSWGRSLNCATTLWSRHTLSHCWVRKQEPGRTTCLWREGALGTVYFLMSPITDRVRVIRSLCPLLTCSCFIWLIISSTAMWILKAKPSVSCWRAGNNHRTSIHSQAQWAQRWAHEIAHEEAMRCSPAK